jgi:hypothetical protein
MSTAPIAASETRAFPSADRGVGEQLPGDVTDPSEARKHGSGSVPRVTAVEMGAASFPASDPPATWTWEVPQSTSRP